MQIFLIGMPGSGKSSLGEQVATKLGLPFYDLDEGIVNELGMSIPEIFDKKGESYFRMTESKLLRHIPKMTDKYVLATGGGAPCFFDNMTFMNEEGQSIYIKVPPHVLTDRLMDARLEERPLLKGKSRDDLERYINDLILTREPYYSKASGIVSGEDIQVEEILEKIMEIKK